MRLPFVLSAVLAAHLVPLASTSAQLLDGMWFEASLSGRTQSALAPADSSPGALHAKLNVTRGKVPTQKVHVKTVWSDADGGYLLDVWYLGEEGLWINGGLGQPGRSGLLAPLGGGDDWPDSEEAHLDVDIVQDDANGQLRILHVTGFVRLRIRAKGGEPSVNEVQVVTNGGATSGTFQLSFFGEGSEPTFSMPFDASVELVQTALDFLPGNTAGDMLVSGAAGGPWEVLFTGGLAATDVDPLVVASDSTDGSGVSVETTTEGVPGVFPDVRSVSFSLEKLGASGRDGDAYGGQDGWLAAVPRFKARRVLESDLPFTEIPEE